MNCCCEFSGTGSSMPRRNYQLTCPKGMWSECRTFQLSRTSGFPFSGPPCMCWCTAGKNHSDRYCLRLWFGRPGFRLLSTADLLSEGRPHHISRWIHSQCFYLQVIGNRLLLLTRLSSKAQVRQRRLALRRHTGGASITHMWKVRLPDRVGGSNLLEMFRSLLAYSDIFHPFASQIYRTSLGPVLIFTLLIILTLRQWPFNVTSILPCKCTYMSVSL